MRRTIFIGDISFVLDSKTHIIVIDAPVTVLAKYNVGLTIT